MRFKFVDPDSIMQVIIALIVLGVGVFAFFTTMNNVPVTAVISNRDTSAFVDQNYSNLMWNQTIYVTIPSTFLNDSTVVEIYGFNSTTSLWRRYIAAGAWNGTLLDSNNTAKVMEHNLLFRHLGGNTSIRIYYTNTRTPTNTFQNATANAMINVSNSGNSVINVVGVVLVLAAIMTIIAIVYTSINRKGF